MMPSTIGTAGAINADSRIAFLGKLDLRTLVTGDFNSVLGILSTSRTVFAEAPPRQEHKPGRLAACRISAGMLRSIRMELAIQVQVEALPEGLFLATSDELPGLVVQGRTVAEALDIARDVARKLIEAQRERNA